MKNLITCSQMKALDRNTIQQHKVPSLVLMERASLAVVEVLEQKKSTLARILVVCGMGDNGGDGIALARILKCRGYVVHILLVGDLRKMPPETRQQYEIAQSYQCVFVNNPAWEEYTTIVDAVFGIGLSREVSGVFAHVINAINQTPARKVAVDIPSGISGDTGQVLGLAVSCEETVTFAYGKPGLYLYPGCIYAGKVTVADIGVYKEPNTIKTIKVLEEDDLPQWLPKRTPAGNKGTFGKVLLLVSEKGMAGAGLLCANGCFSMGVGMVKIYTAEENRLAYQTALPEAIVTAPLENDELVDVLERELKWCDVVAAGPGLGTGPKAEILISYLLTHWRGPLVLDADALNLTARHPEWKSYLGDRCIVTPHLVELSRLMNTSLAEISRAPWEWASRFVQETGAVCVAKDARSWTVTKDEKYLSIGGTNGMATAGAGDVLCGMIAGLLAGGMPPAKAAPLGVCLHALAGEEAARRKGVRGMLAGDISDGLCRVLRRNEE